MNRGEFPWLRLTLLGLGLFLATGVKAQLALSMIDGKHKLVDGANTVTGRGDRDTVTVFDFGVFPPRALANLTLPTSLIGPPMGAAVSPDQKLAVVGAARKLDSNNPKATVPDNRISVIDLSVTPPMVVQTVEAGQGASGISFSPDGRMVVVANRDEGTMSVFNVAAGRLTKVDTIKLGAATSGPSHAAFTPDGKRLLVTRDGDMYVTVFNVADGKLTPGRDITAGIRPYGLAVAPDGSFATVANIGRGNGDADAISIIDLTVTPERTVSFHTVPSQPEALAISPDGRWVAVGSINGSARKPGAPLFNPIGVLTLFAVNGQTLTPKGQYPIGRWVQGIAFSGDSSYLAVQNTGEGEMMFFKVGALGLTDSGVRIPIGESAAGIRIRDFAR